MSYFYNLKIAKKLMASFLLILFLTVVLGVSALRQAGKIDTAAEELGGEWMPAVKGVTTWKSDLQNFRRRQLVRLLSNVEANNVRHEQVLATMLEKEKVDEAAYEALITSPEEKALFDQALALWKTYLDQHRQVMALLQDKRIDDARHLTVDESTKTFNEAMDVVDRIVKLDTDGAASSVSAARQAYASARFWIATILVVCVVAGLALAMWMARLISRPLQSAVDVANRVAAGDLTAQIETSSISRDETGQLMLALRDMNENLRKIVGEVRGGTDTIATASAEIAAGNQDLSSRTEEQASSLEETASSMEELTATVRQNASNARQASDMAQSASLVAQQGGQLVGQVVQTMESISASSKKIADIIGVIDGIAFQTNILALNAAVEAARAGEQGRGFAVVASEVRNLAQRSAAAAKEIKVLIGDSVDQVGEGTRLVGLAGSTMQQIVGSVHGVSEVIAGITIASDEQSTGIDQVNIAVGQMDQVTQQNAALVEQAAAAAESLQEQANRLKEVVGVFQIDAAPRFTGRQSVAATPRLAGPVHKLA